MGILYRLVLSSSIWFCSLSSSAPATKKTLFVVMGGYQSCKNALRSTTRASDIPIAHHFDKMAKSFISANKDLEILTLHSCLNSDAPPDGEAEYVLSDSPSTDRTGDTDKIQLEIEDLVKANTGLDVYLIGHSYGGWMAMHLAENLDSKTQIKGIVTMDPIGPDCTASGVIFGASECHSAPTDLDNKAIRKRVGTWINFYQTEDSWLTSSSIAEASEDHEIVFDWGPHSEISRRKDVWQTIEKSLGKTL